MANTITNTTLFKGKRRLIVQSNVLIDTAAEMTDVIMVDKSTFTGPNGLEPTKLVIENIEYVVDGMQVVLEFDHTTDDQIATLTGQNYFNFMHGAQGFVDPASAGATGDIVLTTVGATVGDKASITLYMRMKD